jgi:hypothetical protein
MLDSEMNTKEEVTVRLDRQTIRKMEDLAARSSTSVSELVARQIEALVCEDDEAYEIAKRTALEMLEKGFDLGGGTRASRDELHER